MRRAGLLALVPALLGAAPPAPPLPITRAVAVAEYPHDPAAYTEGLFIDRGELWESTGEVGRSSVRQVELTSGRVLRQVAVPRPYFGEGIVPWRDQILSLTWQHQRGFRWSRSRLKKLASFGYEGEGWALTSDGRDLIMSDGTPELRFIDPASFKEKRRLRVTANGQPVPRLNELEYVNGEILANVWLTDLIVRIDPATGAVTGLIDVSDLHAKAGTNGTDDVANGIAWDGVGKKLYVTGKRWPVLFEVGVG
ncbi:MAG: glutamine cyclotransferase [Proteobacteria bacterium SG_bin5]|nr:MAG: glutamine cyclotransferase [Proteobacteria bacterium SG_bin5]